MKPTKLLAPLLALAGLLLAAPAQASDGAKLLEFRVDTGNLASLQRGARDFMSYCSGCHGLKYLRYNRIAKDLGIPEEMLKANLMFTTDKPGEVILTSMPKEKSSEWFGATPPDLSLVARSRGADWVYTYLQSFYLDPSRPLGVNNTLLPNASMPHVLWELQGWQAKAEHHIAAEGEHKAEGHHEAKTFELVEKGTLNEEEYRLFVADLTNFLVYAAEPGRNARIARGGWVLAFLAVFFLLASALKKEYWKDVK